MVADGINNNVEGLAMIQRKVSESVRPEERMGVFRDRLTVTEVGRWSVVYAYLPQLSQLKGEANRTVRGVKVRWLEKRGKTLEYILKGVDRQMRGGLLVLIALLQLETHSVNGALMRIQTWAGHFLPRPRSRKGEWYSWSRAWFCQGEAQWGWDGEVEDPTDGTVLVFSYGLKDKQRIK